MHTVAKHISVTLMSRHTDHHVIFFLPRLIFIAVWSCLFGPQIVDIQDLQW